MKDVRTIDDAAKYFSIPKSTLLYWEREGLIIFERVAGNNYRKVTEDTIFQIENVLSLRNLGIPVKKIKNAHLMSLNERLSLYESAVAKAAQKIEVLERIKELAETQLNQIRDVISLYKYPYKIAQPDFQYLTAHSQDTVAIECAETGRFVVLMEAPESGRCVKASICDGTDDILWQRPEHKHWRTFLLDITVDETGERKMNTLSTHLDYLHKIGLQTGTLVARYLSESVENDQLHIYFKAYVETV